MERQKEMDATFLGRMITCDMANCYDCDCGTMEDVDSQYQEARGADEAASETCDVRSG